MTMEERILSTPTQTFIILGLVLAFAYWFMTGTPDAMYLPQIEKLKSQIAIGEKKLKDTEDKAHNKDKLQADMEVVSQTFRLALEYLPRDLDAQDLLRKVSIEARSSGVEVVSFVNKPTGSKEFYDELPMELLLKGSFAQLVSFLSKISRIPRIITVRNVDMFTPNLVDGVTLLQMKGTLVGYRYKEPVASPSPAPGAKK